MRFELDQFPSYQDMNEISQFWASSSRPAGLGEGEVWLDISITPPMLKRFNGTDDEEIGNVRWFDKESGNKGRLLIQSGRTSNASNGTISFDVAYADTPRVIACIESNANKGITWVLNVTTTGFQTINLKDYGSGTGMTGTIQWIAVGVQ